MTRIGLIGLGRQGCRYLKPENGGENGIHAILRPTKTGGVPYNKVTNFGDAYDWLFEKSDACVIATPAETHAGIAIRCLEAGKPVLVEKPLATTWADCARVIDLAERKGLPLLVGHTHLFSSGWDPPPMPAGPLTLMSYYGGPCQLPAWLDWGPHLVAMACSLFSGAPTKVNRYEPNQWLLSFGAGDDLRMAHVGFGDRERYRSFDVWDRERAIWSYDADAPCEHTPMWHQVECFKRMIAGERDRRGDYDFTRSVYRTLFGEL